MTQAKAKSVLKAILDGVERQTGYTLDKPALMDLIAHQIALRVTEEVKSRVAGYNLGELTMLRVVLEQENMEQEKIEKKARKNAH